MNDPVDNIKITPGFASLPSLLTYIDEPNRWLCQNFLADNIERFNLKHGSSHNHQAWPGGYRDHITDAMNIAIFLHSAMSSLGPLPFTLSDAMLVIFLHDIEKLWKGDPIPWLLDSKKNKAVFRNKKIEDYGFLLSEAHRNALQYVEGEGDDYTNKRRVMNELAAFCHMCDVASARIWHSKPLARDTSPET